MTKKYLLFFLFLAMALVSKNADTFALHSGGVEIGNLMTEPVIGQPLTALQVDLTLTAQCLAGLKVWSPSITTLKKSLNEPVLIKITNSLTIPQGIRFSRDFAFAGPTSMHPLLIVNPGDIKYVSIPFNGDLTFVTAENTITFDSHTDSKMLGGHIVFTN